MKTAIELIKDEFETRMNGAKWMKTYNNEQIQMILLHSALKQILDVIDPVKNLDIEAKINLLQRAGGNIAFELERMLQDKGDYDL